MTWLAAGRCWLWAQPLGSFKVKLIPKFGLPCIMSVDPDGSECYLMSLPGALLSSLLQCVQADWSGPAAFGGMPGPVDSL